MSAGSFIAVEWGTARTAARLIADDGSILDSIVEDVRLVELDHAARIARLQDFRMRWPDAARSILLAGMIGSPLGLQSVQHSPCPATAEEIAKHARQAWFGDVSAMFLPGLSCTSRFGDADVLRGEEVAAVGLIDRAAIGDALLLSVPGMHGKWIQLGAERIERFHTSMTVELYRALADRSILAPLMAGPACDGDAFRAGLERGAGGGSLARLLFSARTAVMALQLSEDDAAAYVWGLVIGADVGENLDAMADRPCFVVGADDVAPLFCAAINHLGAHGQLIDNDQLTANGFARLWRITSESEHCS